MDHVYNGKAVATVQNLLRNYYLDTRNLGEQTNTQLLSSSYSSFLSRADHNSFTQCSAIVVPPRLAISAWFCHRENEKKISMTPWLRASSFWPMLHDTHAYSPPHKSASAARSVNIDASSSIVRSFIRPAFFHWKKVFDVGSMRRKWICVHFRTRKCYVGLLVTGNVHFFWIYNPSAEHLAENLHCFKIRHSASTLLQPVIISLILPLTQLKCLGFLSKCMVQRSLE